MVLPDDMLVNMGEMVEIGSPVKVRISNKDFSIQLYENVTPPAEYEAKRFCFDGEIWSYNYEWRNKKLTAAKR